MRKDAVDIARACYDAYVTKDRVAIEALLAEDFHFTSPLDNRLDRATYFERCWPNSETTEGFEFIHLVADEDRVFVTYEGRARGSRFRNTEILTIRGDQIIEAEVYFGWSIPHKAPSGGFIDQEEDRLSRQKPIWTMLRISNSTKQWREKGRTLKSKDGCWPSRWPSF